MKKMFFGNGLVSAVFAVVVLLSASTRAFAGQIAVYPDIDFRGNPQRFGPGVYRADRGQLAGVGNDTISSIVVPFGMSVTVFEHEGGDGRGDGERNAFEPGRHRVVGDDLNDRISMLVVDDFSSTYFSTDAEEVPSPISVRLSHGNLQVSFRSDGQRYHKKHVYDVPPDCAPGWWESTKNGDAGWTANIAAQKLTIDLWVKVRPVAGPRNWVGVRFKCTSGVPISMTR